MCKILVLCFFLQYRRNNEIETGKYVRYYSKSSERAVQGSLTSSPTTKPLAAIWLSNQFDIGMESEVTSAASLNIHVKKEDKDGLLLAPSTTKRKYAACSTAAPMPRKRIIRKDESPSKTFAVSEKNFQRVVSERLVQYKRVTGG